MLFETARHRRASDGSAGALLLRGAAEALDALPQTCGLFLPTLNQRESASCSIASIFTLSPEIADSPCEDRQPPRGAANRRIQPRPERAHDRPRRSHRLTRHEDHRQDIGGSNDHVRPCERCERNRSAFANGQEPCSFLWQHEPAAVHRRGRKKRCCAGRQRFRRFSPVSKVSNIGRSGV